MEPRQDMYVEDPAKNVYIYTLHTYIYIPKSSWTNKWTTIYNQNEG